MKQILFLSMIVLASCGVSTQKSSDADSLAFLKNGNTELKASFETFQIGEVMPEGWLKEQVERDLKYGFVGVLDKLTPEEMEDDLFGSTRRGPIPDSAKGSWLKDLQWWRAEQQGYWWDGLLRVSVLTGNQVTIDKMKKIVDHLVSTQDEDGYLGIYKPETRFSNVDGNGELWAQARMTWVLLTWYNYSKDSSVLHVVKKSIDRTMKDFNPAAKNPFKTELYAGASHGLMYAENVAWVYRYTGDVKYRDYAVWLYQAYCESACYDNDIHYSFLKDSSVNFIGHSAHTLEHLRVLLDTRYFNGSNTLDTLLQNYRHKLEKTLLPSGAAFGFENLWSEIADPDSTPVEYCAITELQLSATHALRLTGDKYWANLTEKIFFNTAQGARLADGKAVTYCKTDNCFQLEGKHLGLKKHAYQGDKDDRYKYSPTHVDVAMCCAPQSTRNYPFYISNMWMRTDSGVAALLLGPSKLNTQIKGVNVSIQETTDYPFDNKIVFTINPETEIEFDLTIRIPDWVKSPVITAGDAVSKENKEYRVFTKKWKKGDKIEVLLNPVVEAQKANNGEYYLTCGAIVYALNVPSDAKVIKTYSVAGFQDEHYVAKADAVYDYSFDANAGEAFGFKQVVTKKGNNMWVASPSMLKGSMIDNKTGKKNDVTLVPVGSTILRKITFSAK